MPHGAKRAGRRAISLTRHTMPRFLSSVARLRYLLGCCHESFDAAARESFIDARRRNLLSQAIFEDAARLLYAPDDDRRRLAAAFDCGASFFNTSFGLGMQRSLHKSSCHGRPLGCRGRHINFSIESRPIRRYRFQKKVRHTYFIA